MASPGNRHCANCIGTLSFPIARGRVFFTSFLLHFSAVDWAVSAHVDISHGIVHRRCVYVQWLELNGFVTLVLRLV